MNFDRTLIEGRNWLGRAYLEASLSYWDGEAGRTNNDSLVDFGLTPVLRCKKKEKVFSRSQSSELVLICIRKIVSVTKILIFLLPSVVISVLALDLVRIPNTSFCTGFNIFRMLVWVMIILG